jgi:uncharacterized membrane protein
MCCGGWRAHRDWETRAYETRRETASSAMEIERFARGEIDKVEFEDKRRIIGQT